MGQLWVGASIGDICASFPSRCLDCEVPLGQVQPLVQVVGRHVGTFFVYGCVVYRLRFLVMERSVNPSFYALCLSRTTWICPNP